MEPPSKESISWVDNYIRQNSDNMSSDNIVRPTLRVRRYEFPSEFEELYSRFVAMLLVLDPRIFLNVMDDCFRDTVDVMNDPRLQQRLNEYLALRSENYYNMNDINGVNTSSPLSRPNSRNGSIKSKGGKNDNNSNDNMSPTYDRGVHFIDYNSPLNSSNSKTRLRPASAGSNRRRRRRKSPRSPKNNNKSSSPPLSSSSSFSNKKRTQQYGQVQFNTDIKYGDWMNERTQLKQENRLLQDEIESIKKDSFIKMDAQNKLTDVMETKIQELQMEMNDLKMKFEQQQQK